MKCGLWGVHADAWLEQVCALGKGVQILIRSLRRPLCMFLASHEPSDILYRTNFYTSVPNTTPNFYSAFLLEFTFTASRRGLVTVQVKGM